jgi:hypothetical protein
VQVSGRLLDTRTEGVDAMSAPEWIAAGDCPYCESVRSALQLDDEHWTVTIRHADDCPMFATPRKDPDA